MEQLHPRAKWSFLISFLFRSVFVFIILMFFWLPIFTEIGESYSYGQFLIRMLPAIVIYLLALYFWSVLSYKLYKYELTKEGFRRENGVIWKRYVTIPYSRIQNVDIYRGVWARILGLSDLHIQTAGSSLSHSSFGFGGLSEGRLPGLSKEKAEGLRNELIARASRSKKSGV